MYEAKPNQKVRIIGVEIAVPADIDCGEQISATFEDSTIIIDWKYTGKEWPARVGSTPDHILWRCGW